MYSYKIGISAEEHDNFAKSSNQTNLLQSSNWAKIKDNWENERIGFYKDVAFVTVIHDWSTRDIKHGKAKWQSFDKDRSRSN